jgi:hypothetical protein
MRAFIMRAKARSYLSFTLLLAQVFAIGRRCLMSIEIATLLDELQIFGAIHRTKPIPHAFETIPFLVLASRPFASHQFSGKFWRTET